MRDSCKSRSRHHNIPNITRRCIYYWQWWSKPLLSFGVSLMIWFRMSIRLMIPNTTSFSANSPSSESEMIWFSWIHNIQSLKWYLKVKFTKFRVWNDILVKFAIFIVWNDILVKFTIFRVWNDILVKFTIFRILNRKYSRSLNFLVPHEVQSPINTTFLELKSSSPLPPS